MQLIEAHKEIAKNDSWNELNIQLEKLTKSEETKLAGDIFELLTKHFLLTDSRYQSILKQVWLLHEVPETIKLKLNLPDEDEGIDLIAETKLGKFWAIQSKYRFGCFHEPVMHLINFLTECHNKKSPSKIFTWAFF